jgi:hypothetical protein
VEIAIYDRLALTCETLRLSQFKKNLRYPLKLTPNLRDSKLRFISILALG